MWLLVRLLACLFACLLACLLFELAGYSWLMLCLLGWLFARSVGRWPGRQIGELADLLASKSICWTFSQSVSQSGSQSVGWLSLRWLFVDVAFHQLAKLQAG